MAAAIGARGYIVRIAIWHNHPSGGGKRAFYNHVRGLIHKGHTVEVWRPAIVDADYLPVSDLIKEHVRPLNWRPRTPSNRLAAFIEFARGPIQLIRALDEHCRTCAGEINSGGFDVFFANTCQVMQVSQIGRYVTIPKVLYVHQPNRALYEAIPDLPWIGRRLNHTKSRSINGLKARALDGAQLHAARNIAREELLNAEAYEEILVNSIFSRESILRAYGLRSKVCYLGIDTALFRPLNKVREHFVVSVGAFYPTKGVELAINSLGLLKEPRPPLVWIANNFNADFVGQMKALATKVGVRLELRTRVPDDELVDALNRAALMLYVPQLEPFGLAPLEAGACGTPVVGIPEGGVRETVIHELNGLMAEPEPQSIATAIEKLLDDPSLAHRYGQQAIEHVSRHWTAEASNDRLEEQLLRIAGRGPSASMTSRALPVAAPADQTLNV